MRGQSLTWVFVLCAVVCTSRAGVSLEAAEAPEGWTTAAPREEIRPDFAYLTRGGRDGEGCFVIEHGRQEGLDGYWTRTFPVEGGRHYRFCAYRRVRNVACPRQSAVVRVIWQDSGGRLVPEDRGVVADYLRGGWQAKAQAEHPMDHQTDGDGWTEVSDTYRAPGEAEQAVVELRLQGAPGGRIEWSGLASIACCFLFIVSLGEAARVSMNARGDGSTVRTRSN